MGSEKETVHSHEDGRITEAGTILTTRISSERR